MALIQTQHITQGGLAPSLQAASAGGDTWLPSATSFLYISNGDSQQHTVTVHTTATTYGQAIPNIGIPVPAGEIVLAGPFDPGQVAQVGTGQGALSYDAVTSVSIAVINL